MDTTRLVGASSGYEGIEGAHRAGLVRLGSVRCSWDARIASVEGDEMRTLRSSLIGTVVLALLSAGGAATAQEGDPSPERILFVGNSFTFNALGVDEHFERLVESWEGSAPVEVHTSTAGGATLTRHLLGTPARIEEGDYSIVVLQGDIPENTEQTVEPFLAAARELDASVVQSGGRSVFYMTWPYVRLGWIGLDDIAAAHRDVAAELGAPVAPVGLAMANSLTERPDLAMLSDDLEHQTIHAAYLAAATIYSTIYDRSPEGLGYWPLDVAADEAAFLQRVAWDTVQEWRAGEPVPAPEAAAWVTGFESCSLDWAAEKGASVGFDRGVWTVASLPLSCGHRVDDPRVSGTATVVWHCDCQLGIGSPVRGSWELQNDGGSWVGHYQGVRSAAGVQHVLLVAEGVGGYEGLSYMANLIGEGPMADVQGVISEATAG